MEFSKNDKNWSRKAGWVALAATTLLTAFFCFWRLGADTILGFDEGRHAVNALEMYRNKDWIISTYNGEIDYFNLKPPLSMYMIMCGYALFGMNTLGIRVGSAFCYLLTALISAGYVAQKKSCWAASFTMLLFGSSKLLLFCSMARKGDANLWGTLHLSRGINKGREGFAETGQIDISFMDSDTLRHLCYPYDQADYLFLSLLYSPLYLRGSFIAGSFETDGIQAYLDDRGESYLILNYIWTEPDERIFDKGEGGETIYRDEYFRMIKKEKQH